jgi:hypothetical protein
VVETAVAVSTLDRSGAVRPVSPEAERGDGLPERAKMEDGTMTDRTPSATTGTNPAVQTKAAAVKAAPAGLYDPRNEHDACGVGFIAQMKGVKSHGSSKTGWRCWKTSPIAVRSAPTR